MSFAGSSSRPNKDITKTPPINGINRVAAVTTGRKENSLKYHFSNLFTVVLSAINLKNIPVSRVTIIKLLVVQSPLSPMSKFAVKIHTITQTQSPI